MKITIDMIYRPEDQKKIFNEYIMFEIDKKNRILIDNIDIEGKNKFIKFRVTLDTVEKRSLDQNKMMWILYYHIAKYVQSNKNTLYYEDIITWAPFVTIKMMENEYDSLKEMRHYTKIVKSIVNENNIKVIYVNIYKSTSEFSQREMAEWLNMLFARCAELGIDVYQEWLEHRHFLDQKKIVLYENQEMSFEKYKELIPYCEATGEWLGTGGEIAHIQSRGAGGNDYPENLLHLNYIVHRGIQHLQGWEEFLQKYPHLKYKVNNILKISGA